jgi:hypothetical protein
MRPCCLVGSRSEELKVEREEVEAYLYFWGLICVVYQLFLEASRGSEACKYML